jgi:ribosomal protein S18 acetylase RimI-like enzyme
MPRMPSGRQCSDLGRSAQNDAQPRAQPDGPAHDFNFARIGAARRLALSLAVMELRAAACSDASAIARLHANSWRLAYRGVLSDDYLDSQADRDRSDVWEGRLSSLAPGQSVFVLVDGACLIGFACVYADHHPDFGSFLNNLHVAEERLRLGCGTRLMSAVRDFCIELSPARPVYLWVVDSNRRAQAFYSRLGATLRGTDSWEPPGGGLALLYRLAWNSPREIQLAG